MHVACVSFSISLPFPFSSYSTNSTLAAVGLISTRATADFSHLNAAWVAELEAHRNLLPHGLVARLAPPDARRRAEPQAESSAMAHLWLHARWCLHKHCFFAAPTPLRDVQERQVAAMLAAEGVLVRCEAPAGRRWIVVQIIHTLR